MKLLGIAIQAAWDVHAKSLPEGIHVVDQPPESAALEEVARDLDARLAAAILPSVEAYQEGRLGAGEFCMMLAREWCKEV